jgi:HEAT repeat protein/S1-C subfamily serine protease/DNA-directed RNA polymerase subunit RPC12/RpoP
MIILVCPECDTELEIPSSQAGKRITCPECDHRLLVPAAKTPPAKPVKKAPAPAAGGPKKAAPSSGITKSPSSPAAAGPKGKAPPPGKTAPKPQRRARDDDEDDGDEREVRKGKGKNKGKPKKSSSSLWIILGVGGVVVLALVGVVVVLFALGGNGNSNPPAANSGPQFGPPGGGAPRGGPMGGPMMGMRGGPMARGGPAEIQPQAEAAPKAEEAKPQEAPPEIVPHGADGQKIYKYLLKSTALIVSPLRAADGRVGLSLGSGGLVDTTNRLLITNYHVVGNNDEVFVFFPTYKDGKLIAEIDYFFQHAKQADALKGKVLRKESKVDLALVQLPSLPRGLQALAFAGGTPAPGTTVYSVGNPAGSGGLWIPTKGEVRQLLHKHKWRSGEEGGKALMECEADVLLTSSPTNHGDSGGPLVNDRGELVAVVHGSSPSERLVSLFIDLAEVRKFLDTYASTSGTKLALEKYSKLGAEVDAGNLPELMRALDSKDTTVRANAARSLGDLGANARPAVGRLLRALHDPDELVRTLALESLNKIGAPDRGDVRKLVDALKDKDAEVRAYAAGALGLIGADGRAAVRTLLDVLKDTEVPVRQKAAVALGKVGGDAKEQVQPALTAALQDSEPEVRAAAAEGLAALPMNGSDVPAMLQLLKHQDTEVREQGALGLKAIGPDAKAAVKPLSEALHDRSVKVRRAALEALTRIGPDKDSVPAVQKLLADSDHDVRRAALEVLASLGPDARAAARDVANALTDKELRPAAVATLKKIGPAGARDAAPELANALSILENNERLLVIEALITLVGNKPTGEEVRQIAPKVIAIFGDLKDNSDRGLRAKAVELLGKLGKPAVPALENALGDTNHLVRLGAAQALGEIGPDAKRAAQLLQVHGAADPDSEVRAASAQAYQKVFPPRQR